MVSLPAPCSRHRRKRYSSDIRPLGKLAGFCQGHPHVGAIYTEEIGGQHYAVGGNTRVPCRSAAHAANVCRQWELTGDCPVPKSERITPRTKSRPRSA